MLYSILIHDFLTQSASTFPDKTALCCGLNKLSYQQLDQYSTNLAASLCKLGLGRQDRVIVFLDNCNETIISLYGISKAAGIFIILNGSLKAHKLAYIIKNSDAKVIISNPLKQKIIEQALSQVDEKPDIIWIPTSENIKISGHHLSWEELIENQPISNVHSLPRGSDQDLASLIYTSGSTGDPKGVMCTHLNMVSAAKSIIQYIANHPDDIILNVLPLSFDYGLYQVLMTVMFGGTVVIEKTFMYIHDTLKKIPEHQITGFPIVPTIVAMLLKMENLSHYDFSSIRYITNTGAALPVEHIRQFRKLFPSIDIISMFGLTECKRVSYLPPSQIDLRPDSVGKAMPGCETFLLDEAGKPVPPGQVGELVIRGPNVMQGYWKDPETTAKTYRPGKISGERWLFSGDYFKTDEEGYLYFLGRKDDMIKSRGERISPKEIENILSEMPGVSEVAVIGIPDDILGQVPKVFIVPANPISIDEKSVLQYSTQNMENFMVPKVIEFVDKLPKTPNGKVDKNRLKAGVHIDNRAVKKTRYK